MRKIKLRVMSFLPDRNIRSVLESASADPHFQFAKGDGPHDFLCGKCRHELVAGAPKDTIRRLVFKCPKCGSFNETDEIGPN